MIDQINRREFYSELFEDRDDHVFVDLGANIGLVSLWAMPQCRRIICVEPELATYTALSGITWPYRDKFSLLRQVVCSSAGAQHLSVDENDFSCHTVTNPKFGSRVAIVPGTTLSNLFAWIGEKVIDVCKVDIEGSEMEILSPAVFRESPVRVWYIEFHKTPGISREKNGTILGTFLSLAGLKWKLVRPNAIKAIRK